MIWPFPKRTEKPLTTAHHDGSPILVPVAINTDPDQRPLPTDIQNVWKEVTALAERKVGRYAED